MADAKISADPTATLTGSEKIPLVQGGANKVTTPDALATRAATALGLGSAATHDASDFATATQGATADSALQPGDPGTIPDPTSANVGDILQVADTSPQTAEWASLSAALAALGVPLLVNTDGDSGRTIFVGSIDPSVDNSPVDGDVWIQTP